MIIKKKKAIKILKNRVVRSKQLLYNSLGPLTQSCETRKDSYPLQLRIGNWDLGRPGDQSKAAWGNHKSFSGGKAILHTYICPLAPLLLELQRDLLIKQNS